MVYCTDNWEEQILDFVKGGHMPCFEAQFELLRQANDSQFLENHLNELHLRHTYDYLMSFLPSLREFAVC